MTIESICNWTWENSNNHRGKVPAMNRDERSAWIQLSDDKMTRKLSGDEFKMWSALNRKLLFRASREFRDVA